MATGNNIVAFDRASRIQAVSEFLYEKNYTLTKKQGYPYHFWTGEIDCKKGKLQVSIMVYDWNFITLPCFFIEKTAPEWLRTCLPAAHITDDGDLGYGLCYSLPDANELPRNNPIILFDWIISQSKRVINQIITNPKYRQKELLKEIKAVWTSLGASSCILVLKENILSDVETTYSNWIINAPEETKKINPKTIFLKIFNEKIPSLRWIIDDMPSNLYLFLKWLKLWDAKAYFNFVSAIIGNWNYFNYHGFIHVGLIIKKDILGVIFIFDSPVIDMQLLLEELQLKKMPNILEKFKMYPCRAEDLSSNFLYSRNLVEMNMKNLKNIKIAIIGCGAIGGYLASNFAKLGAGSESGELWLVDHDKLGSNNIGRHLLGKNYLFLNKAIALQTELNNQLTGLNIQIVNGDAFSNSFPTYQKKLPFFDIIVDATGKMETSETLTEVWSRWNLPKPTLLHVWIQGNGECVQGLLVEPNLNYGCKTCLRQSGYESDINSELSPLGNNYQTKHAFIACSDFTPYAVSSAMLAASLGTDMALDYINGLAAPHYRTRYVERWKGNRIDSIDIPKSELCPYCSQN